MRSSPAVRYQRLGSFAVPWQIERVGRRVIVHPIGHVDDEGLVDTDVFPAVVQTGWHYQQARILLAECKHIQPPLRGRAVPAIEHDDAHQARYNEQAISSKLMEAPGADTARQRGGDV